MKLNDRRRSPVNNWLDIGCVILVITALVGISRIMYDRHMGLVHAAIGEPAPKAAPKAKDTDRAIEADRRVLFEIISDGLGGKK